MDDAATVMVSPAHVAERDGVSRQAVTKIVRHLVDKEGIPVERDGRGRITRFSLAHYDHHRGAFANPAKVKAPIQSAAPIASSDSYDEARRQSEWLKVGREKLKRQEETGQLIRADRNREALSVCGRAIQSLILRLPNRADELALAVSKEGAHGLRVMLREVAFDLSNEVADKLEAIAADAPEEDAVIEDAES